MLTLALATLLVLAPQANAQSSSGLLLGFGGPGAKVVSSVDVPLRVQGQIAVSFHGDPATGCAVDGLCPYSGTIVVRPRLGDLLIDTYRLHGRIGHFAAVSLQSGGSQPLTGARVERSIAGGAGGVCADAEPGTFGELAAATHGGSLSVGLFARGGQMLSTRCAGPLDGDLAGAGPSVTIPLKRAAAGRMILDLSGTGTFASHGFAGTVSSTLVVRLGKPQSMRSGSFPPGIRTQEMRIVTEHLSLVGLSGQLSASVQGSSDPAICQLLDSCGLAGTVRFGRVARGLSATAIATGPAARPYSDFLAALGLSPTGQSRGIGTGLFAGWTQGPLTVGETQAGTCTDSGPGGAMFLEMTAGRGVLRGGGGITAWRTRCPGPMPAVGNAMLTEAVPVRSLAHRTFTVTLRPAGTLQDDGYTISLHGRLTLTFRRGRITQQMFRQPVG
jgi:hypothetical protein